MVTVAGSPQILHVSSSAGPLVGLLMSSGFLVRQVAPGAFLSIAGELALLRRHRRLRHLPADRLASTSTEAIANYVEQSGGGLLLLGGPQSLDAAGYPEGRWAAAARRLRPRGGQRSPAMGLVVAFDKSGSMADSGVRRREDRARAAGGQKGPRCGPGRPIRLAWSRSMLRRSSYRLSRPRPIRSV